MECPTSTVDVSVKRNEDLFTAVSNGDLEEVKRAVAEGASPNTSCDKCYVPALQIAVAKGFDDIVLWLVENGASVTLPNSEGFNAAHLAVQEKNYKFLNAFINHDNDCILMKVDPTYFEETKQSRCLIPLESCDCYDIIDGREKIFVTEWCFDLDFTLLELAVYFEQLEMVELLIKKGAGVHMEDEGRFSPLMIAAIRGTTEILKRLLGVPEVLFTKNYKEKTYNYSALMFAVGYSHLEATKLLIAHGAEVTPRDIEGNSVQHLAAGIENPEILQVIFDNPNTLKMINDINDLHDTPLMCAVKNGFLESVTFLISKRANVNVVNNYGWNLFHLASDYGHKDILKYLLNNRRSKKLRFECEQHGLTPLHLAAFKGRSDCVDVLIGPIGYHSKGIVSSRSFGKLNSGSTVVHAAVKDGNYSILRKLFDFKFNLNVKDSKSMTPLLLAIEMDNLEIVKRLLLNGASLDDRMPGNTGIYENKTALQIIINYYPQPETILEEVLNSTHYISTMDSKKPLTEAFIKFDNLIIHTDNQGNINEGERKIVEYNKFNVVKHLLDCREYKTKEKIILHPVMDSFLFLFNKRFSPIYWCLLFVHFICTVTFSIIVSPKLKLGIVPWYICMAVVIIWLFFINLQEFLLRDTSSDVNARCKFNFQWMFKIFTTILCLASFEPRVIHCIFDLRPFALVCVWFNLICQMSMWHFPGIYLNIFLTVLWKMTRVLLTFWTVIVGFALALQRVFPEADSFEDFFLAITRTLIMTQDLGYGDLITERHSDMAVSVLVMFTLVMSVALANFLTGLAITDVEVLEKHGRVEWLLTRLKFLTDLEVTMGSSPWRKFYLTEVIYLHLFKIENFQIYFNTIDFNKNSLPSKIVNNVLSIILEQKHKS